MRKIALDRIPTFSLILIMVVLMVIGAALIPMIQLAYQPTPKQGGEFSISVYWGGASAQVIEQEIVSRIEGGVATVVGIEEITSRSQEEHGIVYITLKDGENIAAKRFEISSMLKHIAESLPEGAGYPQLNGGNINSSVINQRRLLTYVINSDLTQNQISEAINESIKPHIEEIEGVKSVWVSGAQPIYLDVEYDPIVLESYGINGRDIASAIKNFLGRSSIIGDIDRVNSSGIKERVTLLLNAEQGDDLGALPLGLFGERMVYLRDVAHITSKSRWADRYFRINGMSTINMNINVDGDANVISMSDRLQKRVCELEKGLDDGIYITMTSDAAENIRAELYRLIGRTLLSLLILFLFVLITSRSFRYLAIIAVTLIANILIAVILYYIFDIELHLFSLAGVAVSFGLIIDTSIVMVDHYCHYRNRAIFIAILAALLTTIGSLTIIFFMPDYINADLTDFVMVIMVNLTVSLVVSLLFVPAIIERWGVSPPRKISRRRRFTVRWSRLYTRYIDFTQRRKWIYITLMVLSFGVPLHLLPSELGKTKRGEEPREMEWYEELYNKTFGGELYKRRLKDPLEMALGGSMRLFSTTLNSRTYAQRDRETRLQITANLTEANDGDGNGAILNNKMIEMERFLTQFDLISRFETNIDGASGRITVQFADSIQKSSFPFELEAAVISHALGIGGVDWSTTGVSERGFSNSLNLGQRSYSIEFTGYNYQLLREQAERYAAIVSQSSRVEDVVVEDGRYYGGNMRADKGLALNYDMERVSIDGIDLARAHSALAELFTKERVGEWRSGNQKFDIDYRSIQRDKFDLWSLFNRYITVDDRQVRFSHISSIDERNARQVISKLNQEYTISVAFNYIGSYQAADNYTNTIIDEANATLPIGFRAKNRSWGWYHDSGVQYWLILIIVVIIFFMCSILFESLGAPLVIISLIPLSFIGTFLTFYILKIDFGTGGFASLVMLSGLVVNAAIYLMYEYNSLRHSATQPNLVKLYIRAYNHKIIPVLLTILSTLLGLLPFLLDREQESSSFWSSFAIGSMSGLLFSIIALVLFMPILMNLKDEKI